MIMNALNALDLRLMPCATPGCTHSDCNLWLTQRCHPKAGTESVFDKNTGLLTITCHKCHHTVCVVEVADPMKGQT